MTGEKPLLVDTGKGFTIKYQEKFLYSSLDPVRGVKRQLEALKVADNTVYLIPSVGLGYGLAELLAALPASSFVLCVEKDPLLMQLALSQPYLPLPRHARLVILRTDDPRQACRLLYKQGMWRFRRVKTLPLCAAYRLYADFYNNLEKVLADEIRMYWQNKMTLIHMGKMWIKNAFTNLPLLDRTHSLAELRLNTPLVVTGAGPSLEESLPGIKEVRSQVVLLAVDTALPVLGAYGIKPDFIFVLESQFANIYDFIPYPFFDVPLLCDLTSSPQIIRLFRDKIFFFASRFYPLHLLDRLEQAGLIRDWLPPLGSVGVAAVQAALSMTAGPVIFTGLDFSYPFKKLHARGTPFHHLMHQSQQRLAPLDTLHFSALARRPLLSVTGKGGEPVLSDLVLASYAGHLAEVTRQHPERVFDFGQTGLPSGARQLGSSAELASLLAGQPLPPAPLTLPAPERPAGTKSTATREFREREKEHLQAGLNVIQARLAGPQRTGTGESLQAAEEELLETLDYLYFYFPDKAPLQDLSPGFFARLQQEASYFLKVLE